MVPALDLPLEADQLQAVKKNKIFCLKTCATLTVKECYTHCEKIITGKRSTGTGMNYN
jgi:hypothetical protein